MKNLNTGFKKKALIFINLLLVLVLLVISVYAWFAVQVDNRFDAYDIQVKADDGLELSFDESSWGSSLNLIDLKNSDGSKVIDSLNFVEVTGDGSSFRIPQLTQMGTHAEVNTGATWTDAKMNQDYLEFTVYMRSKEPLVVNLSSESAATPVSSVIKGENCGNPSTYATGSEKFSKDCIVGALRVSYETAANTKTIWITNPEFHLNNKVGSSEYTMDTDATSGEYSTVEVDDFAWNNPYVHYYYQKSDNTVTTYSGAVTSLEDAGSAVNLVTLAKENAEDEYYKGQTTFRVWIEGCDTEARRALVDGMFSLSLVFDTYSTQ